MTGSIRYIDFDDDASPSASAIELAVPARVISEGELRFACGLSDEFEGIVAVPEAIPTKYDVAVDAVKTIPFAVWKRIPAYSLLALVLGNFATCAGFSLATNFAVGTLFVIGSIGCAVSTYERSP